MYALARFVLAKFDVSWPMLSWLQHKSVYRCCDRNLEIFTLLSNQCPFLCGLQQTMRHTKCRCAETFTCTLITGQNCYQNEFFESVQTDVSNDAFLIRHYVVSKPSLIKVKNCRRLCEYFVGEVWSLNLGWKCGCYCIRKVKMYLRSKR